MAPEIAAAQNADYCGVKADIFSLGVLLYIMAFGSPPFALTTDRYFRLLQNRPTKFFELHPRTKEAFKQGTIDKDLQELLLSMLNP